jgi:hypothetical protein
MSDNLRYCDQFDTPRPLDCELNGHSNRPTNGQIVACFAPSLRRSPLIGYFLSASLPISLFRLLHPIRFVLPPTNLDGRKLMAMISLPTYNRPWLSLLQWNASPMHAGAGRVCRRLRPAPTVCAPPAPGDRAAFAHAALPTPCASATPVHSHSAGCATDSQPLPRHPRPSAHGPRLQHARAHGPGWPCLRATIMKCTGAG